MSTTSNGGDPCTYKKIQDDNDTTRNYQNDLNVNISPFNDTGSANADSFNTNTQQSNSSTSPDYSSSSTSSESESMNRSSSDHSTRS